MPDIVGPILLVAAVVVGAFVLGRRTTRRQPEPPDPSRSLWAKVARIETEQKRAGEIIEGMGEGVLVLGESLTPVIANAAARRLLTLPGGSLPATIPSDEVLSTARRCLSEREPIEADLTWSAAGLNLRVRAVPLSDPDGVVMFLHDVTEELRTQQLRRQFVSHASHELKTPVASLSTLVEAIEHAVENDPDSTGRFAARLRVETQRLGALIDDLMDLSRVEDPAAMNVREVDLSDVARIRMKEMEEPAAAKPVTLRAEIVDGVIVRGDEQQLELLVRNLLDNAIRYTPEGGNVTLSLRRDGGRARLDVADDGVGIPLTAQARIFERFFRVDEGRGRGSGGTGLGLSIVKHVTEAHGGSVGVTSELDEGSTFTVALPLAEPAG